jgi:ribosomal protein S13
VTDIPDIVKRAALNPLHNIGQLSEQDVRQLDAFVKKGLLAKAKAGHYPAPKTVWAISGFDFALHRKQAIEKMQQIARFDALRLRRPGTFRQALQNAI